MEDKEDEFKGKVYTINYDKNSSNEGTGWINKNNPLTGATFAIEDIKLNIPMDESEFMHEIRKLVHGHASKLLMNRIMDKFKKGGVLRAMDELRREVEAEILAKETFTHNQTTFTYYLN